jgi:hypothetical protein
MARAARLLLPTCVAAVAALTWHPVLDLELLGWDTYPMIAAAGLQTGAELLGSFGQELMDGRYPVAHYWRPVAHLSFALDHELWGLEPRGYHMSDLALLCIAAALVCILTARLVRAGRGAAAVGAAVAGLAFALHPLHFEVLSVPARRADSLAVVFTLAAVLLQLHRAHGGGPGWSFAAGAACAAAVASKESGVLAVGLVVALETTHRGRRPLEVVRATRPALAFTVLALVLRAAALGGLGGSARSSLGAGLVDAPELVLIYGQVLVLPRTVVGIAGADVWALAVVAAVAALLVLLTRRSAASGADQARPGTREVVPFLLLWVVAAVLITGASGVFQVWYAFPLLAAWALALGVTAGLGLDAARHGPRPAGVAALVLALGCTAIGAAGSMLFDPAPELIRASRVQREFLDRFELRLAGRRRGGTVTLDQAPRSLTTVDERGMVRHVYLLAPYSLEAYADLVLGAGSVRVSYPGVASLRPPAPDRTDVVLIPVAVEMAEVRPDR